jgi:hypothetical protein
LTDSIANLAPDVPVGSIRIEALCQEDRIREGSNRTRWRTQQTRPFLGRKTEAKLCAKSVEQLIWLGSLHRR